MKLLLTIPFLAWGLFAQTTVYVRSGAPAPVPICGVSNASPAIITTCQPHNFSSSCSTGSPCYCAPNGTTMGLGPNPVSGPGQCVYVDSTHLAFYTTGGSPVSTLSTGNWFINTLFVNATPTAQWVDALVSTTILANPGPLGWLDGTTGPLMRELALNTRNGLTSVVLTGGSAGSCASTSCTGTITTSINPLTMRVPVAVGNQFSINSTGTVLDTCGSGGGVQSPYTVATVNSTGWTFSVTCASLTTGTYTGHNLTCGPPAIPNDTIGGTLDCITISLLAYTGNVAWNAVVNTMNNQGIGAPSGNNFKSIYDGGNLIGGPEWRLSALRFLVEPNNSGWLNELIYSLNFLFRPGIGFPVNSASGQSQPNVDYNYNTDYSLQYVAITQSAPTSYWTASEHATFLNMMFNDCNNPSTPCTTINQDAANPSTHNWVLSTGNLAAGTNDSTHAQLPSSDPHYSTTNYYVGTVIMLQNGNSVDYQHYSYGIVTAQSNVGVLTVAGGWFVAGQTPTLSNLITGTVTGTGSLTVTGSTGQYCTANVSGGTSSGSGWMKMYLTAPNTINSSSTLSPYIPGTGYSSGSVTSPAYGGTAGCTGSVTINLLAGTPYMIYDTLLISSTTPGATAIVSLTKSTVSGTINVGDGILGQNGWFSNNGNGVAAMSSYVTLVGSGTCGGTPLTSNQLCVLNNNNVNATVSGYQVAWRLPQWITGDIGLRYASKSNSSNSCGYPGAIYGPGQCQNIVGWPNLGSAGILDTATNGAGAGVGYWPTTDLVMAIDDSRAQYDLVTIDSWLYDYGARTLVDYLGRGRNGPGYSLDADLPNAMEYIWGRQQTVPNVPDLCSTSLTWCQTRAIFDIFATLPDNQGGATQIPGYGGAGSQSYSLGPQASNFSGGTTTNPTIMFAPTTVLASMYRNWLTNISPNGSMWGTSQSYNNAFTFLLNDPRVGSTTYTVLPHQYIFNNSSSSQVTAITGWPHIYRGDYIASRTGFTSTSDTYVSFDSSTYVAGTYDSPRVGQVFIWNTGCLLGADNNNCNGIWAVDSSVLSDSFQFSGSGNFIGGALGSQIYPLVTDAGFSPFYSWSSDTAGSYGPQYGDANSNFAAACTSVAPNYNQSNLNIAIDHANVCWVHFKYSGHDQFIMQAHDVALAGSSPSPAVTMNWHLHYPQNGQVQSGGNYCTTGSTTLAGGIITSAETGAAGCGTHGLQSKVFFPTGFTGGVNDDCVGLGGGGQCSPGDTYPGGNGYTHRFTVYGGASTSATVGKFASVTCHKVMASLGDTTFSGVGLNPDANWTGAACTGANSTAVLVVALNSLHSTITSFATSFSGPGDWVIEGLSAGVYAVTVGGSPVSGSPFTVQAGDNSIAFQSTAGTFALNAGSVVVGGSVGGPKGVGGPGAIKH